MEKQTRHEFLSSTINIECIQGCEISLRVGLRFWNIDNVRLRLRNDIVEGRGQCLISTCTNPSKIIWNICISIQIKYTWYCCTPTEYRIHYSNIYSDLVRWWLLSEFGNSLVSSCRSSLKNANFYTYTGIIKCESYFGTTAFVRWLFFRLGIIVVLWFVSWFCHWFTRFDFSFIVVVERWIINCIAKKCMND